MKTVLVTGAGGFVGRHVCHALAQAGLGVRAAVRGALPEELRGKVQPQPVPDLCASDELDLSGVHAVVHLAARVHVMQDLAADPLAEHRRVNTEATLRLARSAARQGVARFIFMSTVKVNGERTRAAPFSDRDAAAPADPYAISKWEAERGLRDIARLEVVCLRPPLVYGPGVKGNFLRLMKLVRRGVPLPLASVANARSMIYAGNLASAVARAVSSSATGTFLVSDDAELSTPQLVRLLAAAMGARARLLPFPPRALSVLGRALGRGDEVTRMLESLRVDCSGFKQQFQWAVPFSIEQGLKATAEWFARTRSAA